ncbi:MAG: polysaccharide biosynthesis tyrosine autokinase, partial [Bacteroidota bacterium]
SYQRSIQAPLGIEAIADQYSTELTETNRAITELSLQKDFLAGLIQFLNTDGNEYKFLTVPAEAAGEIVSALVTQYNDLIVEREKLLLSADLNNPYVKLMDEQISSIKRSIIQSVDRLQLDVANRMGKMEGKINPVVQNLNAIPQQQRELLTITRQKNIKEELYLYLLQSREKAGLSIASQTVNIKIIDPPVNKEMVAPNHYFIYVLGVMLGLILPLGFIVGSEVLDNTIHYENDIKEYTHTPFLGNIGLARKRNELQVMEGSRSAISESFHLLRSNLQFMTPNESASQVVLVTSSISGEGKTFVTSNLGASFALAGKKTVLVSFDLRKPKLSAYVTGAKTDAGISNFLSNPRRKMSGLIKPIEGNKNLFYLASGPIPPNPTDLMHKERTKEMFDYLRANFDLIMVDTSPVGLVSDALILSQYADASIFITRFKKTQLGQIALADELYLTKKLPSLSIVLNGIRKRRYGYAYGYGYGYGYGYYEEDKSGIKNWLRSKFRKKAANSKTKKKSGISTGKKTVRKQSKKSIKSKA